MGSRKTLDVYSSPAAPGRFARPDRGAHQRHQARARAGAATRPATSPIKYTIARRLHGARPARGTPEATQANARKVAQDKNAVVYIGEFNSGASAISIPILNEAGIPQVSPANTAVGLTTNEPGAEPGEPDKYYPTRQAHLRPHRPEDTIQGAALATLMKQDGCTKVAIANDKEVYGAGLAKNIELAPKAQRPQDHRQRRRSTRTRRTTARWPPRSRAPARTASSSRASPPTTRVQLYKDFAAALPNAKLYGPDGVAESGFSTRSRAASPPPSAQRVKVTVATLVAGRATRRRARSSSRTSRRSTARRTRTRTPSTATRR